MNLELGWNETPCSDHSLRIKKSVFSAFRPLTLSLLWLALILFDFAGHLAREAIFAPARTV
jgi:hypothetical protein